MSTFDSTSRSPIPDAADLRRLGRWRCAGPLICAAIILVMAGSLKAYQLVTDPALGVLYGSRWIEASVAEYELLLGAWLLSGARVTLCRRIAFFTFGAFGIASFYYGISGQATCGCFGSVHVSPWWSFGLDVAIAGLLWFWTPLQLAGQMTMPRTPALARCLVTVNLLGALIVPVLVLSAPQHAPVVVNGAMTDQGSVLVLEPEKWIGRPFALADDIDIGEQLLSGSWILVLYHHSCSACQEVLPAYGRLACFLQNEGHATRVAFIEVPPYSSEQFSRVSCVHGRLSNAKTWYVTTPTEVSLRNGRVISSTSTEADFSISR